MPIVAVDSREAIRESNNGVQQLGNETWGERVRRLIRRVIAVFV
jgi:hypothetical protein